MATVHMNWNGILGECSWCHKRRGMARRDFTKAARPRCYECGGPMEEIVDGRDPVAERDAVEARRRTFHKKIKG